MQRRETSADIDEVAADWAVRVNSAPLSPTEQAELDAWLAENARHLGAYARHRAMYSQARRVKALGPEFDPELFARANGAATDAVPLAQAEANPAPEPDLARPSRRRFILLGGSAVAVASLAGMFGLSMQAAAQTYSTKRGEIRLVPLEDGSSITLNTESTVRVKYGEKERHVELVEGEALFDVTKDTKRPFVVAAGDTSVRAVGTSFSVSRLADAPVQVVVRTGVVEVMRPATPQAPVQRAVANTRTIAVETAPLATTTIAPAEVGRSLAWREGMLSFEDTTLEQAAEEFARYSDVKIRFADPSIGKEAITGLYAANNPTGFARTVATSLELRVATTSDGIVLER